MPPQLRAPGPSRHLPMLVLAVFFMASTLSAAVRLGWIEAGIPAVILLTTVPPIIAEKWARIRIPFSLQLLYGILLITGPYIGGHLGLYQAWDPWDNWVHLYSGFPVSLGAVLLLGISFQRSQLRLPLGMEALLIISLKALVALLWEIGEFVFDEIFDADTQDHNFDTMTDMIFGMVPGFLVAAALVLYRTKGRFQYVGFLLNVPQPPLNKDQ